MGPARHLPSGNMIGDSGKMALARTPERFYMLNQPEPSYQPVLSINRNSLAPVATVARCGLFAPPKTPGLTLSPLNGFLLLQGIETIGAYRGTSNVEKATQGGRVFLFSLRRHNQVAWV